MTDAGTNAGKLRGKTAVVTGGSRGIGAAIVRAFASQGANVAVIYAGNREAAQEVCTRCEAEYQDVYKRQVWNMSLIFCTSD